MRRNNQGTFRRIILFTAILSILMFSLFSQQQLSAISQLAKKATVVSAKLSLWSKGSNGAISTMNFNDASVTPLKNKVTAENIGLSTSYWSMDMAPEETETPSDQTTEIIPSTLENTILEALPYPTVMEAQNGIIKQVSYTPYNGTQYLDLLNGGQVRNCTSVSNDSLMAESTMLPEFKIQLNGEPQVLIMHTHTTESYEPYDRDFFDASFSSRTTDVTKNVVAVGDAIEQELINAGIGVIHDTTVHDYPNYNGSYDRSEETVKAILAQYPSIKIVLDVHRDAIQSNGVRNSPVAEINGKKAAQIMIISGCDDGTMNMPNYMKNFRLASLLQQQLEGSYTGITRPILFDYRNYNQQLTTGSLLLEMGSHGNSIEQAIYSGELLGKSLVKTLLLCV